VDESPYDQPNDQNDKRFELLEARIEGLEEQFAKLFMGYAELTAAFEALMWQLFGGQDATESAEFRTKFEKTRAGLIGFLNDATKHMDLADDSLDARLLKVAQDDPAFGQGSRRTSDLPDGSDSPTGE
jgi:hypothetical protein